MLAVACSPGGQPQGSRIGSTHGNLQTGSTHGDLWTDSTHGDLWTDSTHGDLRTGWKGSILRPGNAVPPTVTGLNMKLQALALSLVALILGAIKEDP